MKPTRTGTLVKVAAGGPPLDGIVFDTPSRTKVVVAVLDPGRGPALRTVPPDTLTEREAEGPSDAVLRQLIRRTPTPAHGAARGGPGAARGHSGHTRGAAHRTTGR
jgi:hypothetical protein